VSSYTGENARQLRRPASRGSAPRRALARAPGPVPCDGRDLDHCISAGVDAPAGSRDQAVGKGPARRGVRQQPKERCQRCRSTGRPVGRKSPGALPVRRASALRRVDRTEAGGRAVKHAAAGGRMTARWSGAPWKGRWQHLSSRDGPRSWTLAGLPTAPGRQSPEVESISSARDVNVGCRSGAMASWRRVRGKPRGPTRRVVQRGRRSLTRTGSRIIPLRDKGAQGAS